MIIGFQLREIDSKIFEDAEELRKYQSININYDINLSGSSVVEKQTAFGKMDVLRVRYTFSINYLNPNIGHIRFEGTADYFDQKRSASQLKDEWDKGRAPTDVQNEIANAVILNLIPLALTISQRLGLPPSVPLPTVNLGAKEQPKFTHYHG